MLHFDQSVKCGIHIEAYSLANESSNFSKSVNVSLRLSLTQFPQNELCKNTLPMPVSTRCGNHVPML